MEKIQDEYKGENPKKTFNWKPFLSINLTFIGLVIVLFFTIQLTSQTTYSIEKATCTPKLLNESCSDKEVIQNITLNGSVYTIETLNDGVLNERCKILIDKKSWGCRDFLIKKL